MKKPNKVVFSTLSFLVVASLALSACAPVATPAVTEPTKAEASVAVESTKIEESAAAESTVAPEAPKINCDDVILGAVWTITTDNALYGIPQMWGTKMAVDDFNNKGGVMGCPVKLIGEDGADTATTAINAFNKVLESNPIAASGPILGTMMIPLRDIIDEEQIPGVAGSGTRAWTLNNNKYFLRIGEFDGTSKVALTDFIVNDLKATKIGFLTTADVWGYSAVDYVGLALERYYNIKYVAAESYQATDKDMSAQLLNLKNAGVDIIIHQGHPADLALILKQKRQLGIDIPMISGGYTSTAVDSDITTAEDVEGLYTYNYALPVEDPDPELQAWAKRYREYSGLVPNNFAVVYYEGITVLLEAMQRAAEKGNFTRAGVTEELWKTDKEGMIYHMKPDKEGNIMKNYVFGLYGKDKKLEIVARKYVPDDRALYDDLSSKQK